MGFLNIERKYAWSLSGFVIGIISLIAAVTFFYYSEFRSKIDFNIVIEEEFNIVELNELIPDLKIVYQDNDIIEEGKQLKVIVYSFENLGEPILQNFYDQLNPFKISFEESEILKTEIISSNSDYLKYNLLKSDTTNIPRSKIDLNKVIFERNKKITLKSYLMQPEVISETKVNVEGKIMGIDNFNITRKENLATNREPQLIDNNFVKIFVGVYLGIIILMIGIVSIIDAIEKKKFRKIWKEFISLNPDFSDKKSDLEKVFLSPKRQRILNKMLENNYTMQFSEFINEVSPKPRSLLKRILLSSISSRMFSDSLFDFENEGVSVNEEVKEPVFKFVEHLNSKKDSD